MLIRIFHSLRTRELSELRLNLNFRTETEIWMQNLEITNVKENLRSDVGGTIRFRRRRRGIRNQIKIHPDISIASSNQRVTRSKTHSKLAVLELLLK